VHAGVDLDGPVDWSQTCAGADVVVHCAGVAHTTFANETLARSTFERVNRVASGELARAAAAAEVGRFVFVSSIGVYGNLGADAMAAESMKCQPVEPYASSKYAAERDLEDIFRDTATELVVVRPPLVYGQLCPGNFARLVKLVRSGLPLPLGSIRGRRHFVSVDNLADFIVAACSHEGDARGTFNVADAEEIDLKDILRAIGEGTGRRVRLVYFPLPWLRSLLRVVGREATLDKLDESILVDASRAREHFGWTPRISTSDGMRAAAASFRRGVEP